MGNSVLNVYLLCLTLVNWAHREPRVSSLGMEYHGVNGFSIGKGKGRERGRGKGKGKRKGKGREGEEDFSFG